MFSVSSPGEDTMGRAQTKSPPTHFKTMMQLDVPQGRHGKHKEIVATILKDLDNLKAGSALKVPLADLAESKEKVRSALNRATRQTGRNVATASDDTFLYVWNVSG
jgi:DNA helicase TIP49 (TBP-interacting protein)